MSKVVALLVNVRVEHCPRCGKPHDLQAKLLVAGVQKRESYVDFTHWAKCPMAGEPVLFNVDVNMEWVPEILAPEEEKSEESA